MLFSVEHNEYLYSSTLLWEIQNCFVVAASFRALSFCFPFQALIFSVIVKVHLTSSFCHCRVLVPRLMLSVSFWKKSPFSLILLFNIMRNWKMSGDNNKSYLKK